MESMASHASVQPGEEAEKPLPARGCASPERTIRHRIAHHPPFLYDAVSTKILSSRYFLLPGICQMQAPITQEVRNLCELRLPAWSNAPARLATLNRGFVLFRPLHPEGGQRKQCMYSRSRRTASQQPAIAICWFATVSEAIQQRHTGWASCAQ